MVGLCILHFGAARVSHCLIASEALSLYYLELLLKKGGQNFKGKLLSIIRFEKTTASYVLFISRCK
jgi:hypothetical protein